MEKINPGTVFGNERSDQVDFEIAFTAFVVTIVLSIPADDIGYVLLKGLVISLSGLTLLRKMAVSNQHGPSEPILRWTMPFIQAITVLATVHIFLEAGKVLSTELGLSVSPVVAAAPFIPLFVLGVFGFHEKVTRDASLYIGLLSYNASKRAEEAEIFGLTESLDDWFLDHAGQFVSFSNSTAIPPELSWLEYRGDSEASPPLLGVFAVGMAGYILIWVVISWVFGSSILNLVFLAFVFLTKYPIQFWYSRFGLARFTSDRSGWFDASIILIGLIAANLTILPRYG